MHYKEFLNYPIDHITNLPTAGAYGLGYLHPIIFTLIIYIFAFIPRFFVKLIKKKGRS